jgi:hypothetical protein
MTEPWQVDRRKILKWVLSAAASSSVLKFEPMRASTAVQSDSNSSREPDPAKGYGTDPDLMAVYRPGELWPLSLTAAQRHATAALCDLIIPADEKSPSASAVGVVDFIDEWISAPYAEQRRDRTLLMTGLAGLDEDSRRHFGTAFAELRVEQRRTLCDEICYLPKALPEHRDAALFFARFRDLTAGAFYTTPQGTHDLGFVGNVALSRFDGPPLEVLKKAGLA